jgi:hypothetical protein
LNIFHQFPHAWIVDLHFVNVNSEHSKTSSPEKIRYVPGI